VNPLRFCVLIVLVAALSACGTPQPALDQANSTAAVAAALQNELANYKAAAARVAAARLASVRNQEALIAQLQETDAFNVRTARLAGLGATEDARRNLVELAQSRADDEAATRKRLAELDQTLKDLVKPLPGATEKLKAVQEALGALGTELSTSERLSLTIDAVRTVREELEKNKAAAAAAAGSAKAAPVPATP
jgi:DNA repair exonuclease SbcCD ATPase subunit